MSYLVHLSLHFPMETAGTYEKTKRVLNEMGLYGSLAAKDKTLAVLPRNTFAGQFEGENASTIRADLGARVAAAFKANGIAANIFISVGGTWAWWSK